MKNVRIKVVENCAGSGWWYGIYWGKKNLFCSNGDYERKGTAIRNAKAMAKRIGIKYDPEIIVRLQTARMLK